MKFAQLCPTLCNPMNYTVHGILQARILESVAIPVPRRSFQPRDQTQVSRIAGGFFTTSTTWESESRSVVSNSLRPYGLYSPRNSPGQNTGVGSLSLLQGIFPTQGSNPGFQHCKQIFYQLSHQGSPGILEWVAYPFSSRSS